MRTICFNPRTHTGCDRTKDEARPRKIQFQSTHPHGVRLQHAVYDKTKRKFQSTHPHGVRRGTTHRTAKRDRVSIHAPTRGATFTIVLRNARESLFQSTHPHGVRPPTPCNSSAPSWFQSTHPHGVRPPPPHSPNHSDSFQSTHPHGVRLLHKS